MDDMAREYVERMAYHTIEQAANSNHNGVTQHRISCTSEDSTSSYSENFTQTHKIVTQQENLSPSQRGQQGQKGGANVGVLDKRSLEQAVVQSSLNHHHNQGQNDVFYMLNNVKKKLSSNLEHYFFQVGLPVLFRKRDKRSRSRSRSGERNRRESRKSSSSDQQGLDDGEDFEFVENIELSHMDGFVLGSRPELGKGHKFEPLNLNTPTWCDKCGDFIWGVYKQCLKCRSKSQHGIHSFPCLSTMKIIYRC